MLLFILSLIGGSIGLYYGADRLVAGSSALALRTGISPMLIGLTIVAFATSSPELIVSLKAAFQGNPSIAIGNVVGSNIANIGLVLALSAIVYPVKTRIETLRIDMPIMIAVVFVMFALMYNHMFLRMEGFFLVFLLAVFLFYQIRNAQSQVYAKNDPEINEILGKKSIKTWLALVYVIAGGALLVIASDWFLYGAIGIGQILGISDAVIGLTLVSVGTSLPELATSIIAAFKKESDIALGNIIGSNIFNVLAILGITASIHPLTGGDITWIDLGVMLAFSVLLWPLMRHKMELGRIKGAFLFAGYVVYMWYLFG